MIPLPGLAQAGLRHRTPPVPEAFTTPASPCLRYRLYRRAGHPGRRFAILQADSRPGRPAELLPESYARSRVTAVAPGQQSIPGR
jgi:hypothetical protein